MIGWGEFRVWNGGQLVNNKPVGGEPVFAGRHFLGGDLIWGHGEATDALDNPSPENLSNLKLLTNLIAPMQAPQSTRQQVTGALGYLYGKIDGDAICNRLAASIVSHEFNLPAGNLVHVWLSVDSASPFSVDYWAGWSDQVNRFAFFIPVTTLQPFRACINCAFAKGITGKLEPVAQVLTAIATSPSLYSASATTCYALWADVVAAQPLDWSTFSGVTMPLLWRFSHDFRNDAGAVVDDRFDVDASNTLPGVQDASNFMLRTTQWQATNDWLRYGVITDQEDGITAAQIASLHTTPIPQIRDLEPHYTFSGGSVSVIGRYLKPSVVNNAGHAGHFVMGRAEALTLSANHFEIFTIWEDINALARKQALDITYFDPAIHAGTEDGRNAFAYCGGVLRQPPYTPVFFAVDFDPEDPAILGGVSPADAKNHIIQYFVLIRNERDAYANAHPGRYYLIGVYGKAAVLEWCYKESTAVSMFWQSASTGSSNRRPKRPWCHANRWQIADDSRLRPGWNVIPGADPDVDWFDGGTWQLSHSLEQQLEQAEDAAAAALLRAFVQRWGTLFDFL